ILDFGISKVGKAGKHITRDHLVFGTPQYMSPEQAQGRRAEIDARTDQFALAAMTFEMLTGREAFDGEDPMAILYSVVNEPPRAMAGLAPFESGPDPAKSTTLAPRDPAGRTTLAPRSAPGVPESAAAGVPVSAIEMVLRKALSKD